jgi:GNAT superfamily N-acetyltransferase
VSAELPAIRRVAAATSADLDGLTDLLLDCVAGGASIGFMEPLTTEHAREFWVQIAADVATGERVLLVAEDDAGVCGTVQLVPAQKDNQPHRADVSKMLVHRRARRRGLGAALMRAIEMEARALGRSLLVLDTATGSDAERLYERLGWERVGVVPDYALWPDGGLCATTFFYRRVG